MVMCMRARIEKGGRSRLIYLADDTELDKRIKHPIHRRSRQAGYPALDVAVYFVGGEVVLPLEEGIENRTPLYRQRETAITTQPLELLQAVTLM